MEGEGGGRGVEGEGWRERGGGRRVEGRYFTRHNMTIFY